MQKADVAHIIVARSVKKAVEALSIFIIRSFKFGFFSV